MLPPSNYRRRIRLGGKAEAGIAYRGARTCSLSGERVRVLARADRTHTDTVHHAGTVEPIRRNPDHVQPSARYSAGGRELWPGLISGRGRDVRGPRFVLRALENQPPYKKHVERVIFPRGGDETRQAAVRFCRWTNEGMADAGGVGRTE